MTAAPRCCTVGMKVSLNQLCIDHRQRRLAVDGGVMQVRILGRRMVAPDDDLLDLRQGRAGFLGELRQAAVVIQSGHRRESVARQRWRIALRDERIGIGRIADDQHAHIAARDRIQRLALRGKNFGVFQQADPCAPCPDRAAGRRPASRNCSP